MCPAPGDLDWLFCQQIASLNPAPRRWLIAHSGGLDSQVLLHLAARHLPANSVQVLHINHQIQTQSEQWAQFSAAQAKALELDHRTFTLTLGSRSESSAREGRYAAFARHLQDQDCLLMGHHADDQAETLLFRLLRGTGLSGLSGIPVQRTLSAGQLFRPLLSVPRSQLESWAKAQGLQWIDDPSNQQNHYDRNYLRNRVMPILAERWPGFVGRWGQTAELVSESEQLLNDYLDRDLAELQGNQRQLYCGLLPLEPSRRRALLRRWLQVQGITVGIERLQRIESELIGAAVDAQPQLKFGNRLLRRYRQQLFCLPAKSLPPESLEGEFQAGEFELGDGLLQVTAASHGLASLAGVRLVRRQGGEQLRPYGRNGSCSLKKLLQEQHVPPWQRESWPLLIRGGEVVAVPGICVCENAYSESEGFTLNWLPF